MASLSERIFCYYTIFVLLSFMANHHVRSSRFLPTVVWDHLNPMLHCKCNWLVIPNVDLYDKQIFTCPTDKVTTNLVDGSERTGDTRNENIYRRKWNGNRNDFISRVRNGTIDSFCDPKSSETVLLHRCRNGNYDSFDVTYKYNKDINKKYDEHRIYIFFNNGDGTVSSLTSNEAKCSVLFAVYVTRDRKSVYGMNFGKKGLTLDKDCDISSCPVVSTEKPTLSLPTFPKSSSSSKITLATKPSGVTSGPKNAKITPENTKITPSSWPSGKIVEKMGSTKPANNITGSSSEAWLTTTVFISATASAFVFGIIVVAIILACKKTLQKKDRFHFV